MAEQGVLNAAYDAVNHVLKLEYVSAAPAWVAHPPVDADGIWNDVFDPVTNTIRYVEV